MGILVETCPVNCFHVWNALRVSWNTEHGYMAIFALAISDDTCRFHMDKVPCYCMHSEFQGCSAWAIFPFGWCNLVVLQSIPYRKILEDDHMGHQLIEVEHIGEWRFLMFHGTLHTKMYVRQNRRTHTVNNSLSSLIKCSCIKWVLKSSCINSCRCMLHLPFLLAG